MTPTCRDGCIKKPIQSLETTLKKHVDLRDSLGLYAFVINYNAELLKRNVTRCVGGGRVGLVKTIFIGIPYLSQRKHMHVLCSYA